MNQDSARARGKSYLNPFRSPKSVSPGPISRIYFSQNCSALVCSLVQFSVTAVEHLGEGGGSMVQISQEEIFISWLAFVAENKYFDAYLEVHLIYTYTSYILHYYMAQQSLYLFN